MKRVNHFVWPRGWRMAFVGKGKRVLVSGLNIWALLVLLLMLAVPASAALNATGYTSSGASLAADNGTWALSSGVDANGNKYFILGSKYAYWNSGGAGGWLIGSTLNQASGYNDYSNLNGASPTTFPLTGWTAQSAAAPVPTFVAASSAPTVYSVSVSPSSISAVGTTNVTMTVTLSAVAPTGGASVTISNVNSGFGGSVSFTPMLTIPAGSMAASENLSVSYSSGSGSCVMTGAYNSSSASVTITMGGGAASGGATVSGLQASPSPGSGGANSTGTVTLSAVAPSGGYSVALSSSNTAAASVPASVVVPAGSTTSTFVITCPSTSAAVSTTLSAVGGSGSAVTLPFQVNAGTTAGTSAPTVSISLSSNNITAGASSVLSWSSSGASSITVTGVTSPPFVGSTNVSPSATTTYTVTATNSAGTASQTATLTVNAAGSAASNGPSAGCVGSSAGCGDGSSSYSPGLGFLAPPGISAPGDLKIGIPGIGSIGLPSGWWTQIIQFATQAAMNAQGLSGSFLISGMQAASTSTNNTLLGVQSGISGVINSTSSTLTSAVNSASNAVTNSVSSASTAITTTVNNAEKTAVSDGQAMLQSLLYSLFVPDAATFETTKAKLADLLNWGPYALVASFVTTLSTPAGDGTLGGVSLGIPVLAVNTNFSSQINIGGVPLASAMTAHALNGVDTSRAVVSAQSSGTPVVSVTQPGQWYATGQTIPFDKTGLLASPAWPAFRAFIGLCVWVVFLAGLMNYLMPKQTF